MNQITIKGKLTPGFVSTKLSPFLDALTGLQHTIDVIKQVPPSSVTINQIDSEGSTEDNSSRERESATPTSWSEAKQALLELRLAIEALYEEPKRVTLQKAKTSWANAYLHLDEAIINLQFAKGMARSPSTIDDDDNSFYNEMRKVIQKSGDEDDEYKRIIALLKGRNE
jgi:hypothetical protein